jgi:hypothetical protein
MRRGSIPWYAMVTDGPVDRRVNWEVEMDTMMARMQIARLLARMVTVHVPAWLGGLPEGIEEWLAGLRLGGGRVEGARGLQAQRA